MERAGVIVADSDLMIRGVLRSMLVGVGQNVFLAAYSGEALIGFRGGEAGITTQD